MASRDGFFFRGQEDTLVRKRSEKEAGVSVVLARKVAPVPWTDAIDVKTNEDQQVMMQLNERESDGFSRSRSILTFPLAEFYTLRTVIVASRVVVVLQIQRLVVSPYSGTQFVSMYYITATIDGERVDHSHFFRAISTMRTACLRDHPCVSTCTCRS
jgi:hypothetical protein